MFVIKIVYSYQVNRNLLFCRDYHAWCPYCQKVWLWLEEKRIPYKVQKITMNCYGKKESWYKNICPNGVLPALELDGNFIVESDDIISALETNFGPLHAKMDEPRVRNYCRTSHSTDFGDKKSHCILKTIYRYTVLLRYTLERKKILI